MRIPLVDLTAQYLSMKPEIDGAIASVTALATSAEPTVAIGIGA